MNFLEFDSLLMKTVALVAAALEDFSSSNVHMEGTLYVR
jgi:hypothetical protein